MVEEQDERILATLQRDGRATNQQLAEAVGMSTSACWRRVRGLEEAGVISGYSAYLTAIGYSPVQIGLIATASLLGTAPSVKAKVSVRR